jgi:hypothetical protein
VSISPRTLRQYERYSRPCAGAEARNLVLGALGQARGGGPGAVHARMLDGEQRRCLSYGALPKTSRLQGQAGWVGVGPPVGRWRPQEPDREIEQRNERSHLRIERLRDPCVRHWNIRKSIYAQVLSALHFQPWNAGFKPAAIPSASSQRGTPAERASSQHCATNGVAAAAESGLGFCFGRPDPVRR